MVTGTVTVKVLDVGPGDTCERRETTVAVWESEREEAEDDVESEPEPVTLPLPVD